MIILCLIGKSASGKTFVRDKLVKERGYKSLVTFTSRPPRKNEKQDITYHFISKEDFEQKIEQCFFAEWKKYNSEKGTWYYGTALVDCNDADDNIVTILTPDGVRDLQKLGINMVVIYLYSNISTINTRLTIRGDDSKEKERRIEADIKDFKDADTLADRIVYNNLSDDIESVVENVDYWYKKILKEKSNGK